MGKLIHDELKNKLYYDELTGIFTRLVSNSPRVKIGDIAGSKITDGYIYIQINRKLYLAHRLAWLYVYGYFPENEIDHINRIKDDNRIINLREASRQCNMRNRNTQKNNTSGIVGVGWNKRSDKWLVRIKVNGKNIYIGYFKDKTNAVKARWEAEVKYNYPNCNTISTSYLYLKEKQLI